MNSDYTTLGLVIAGLTLLFTALPTIIQIINKTKKNEKLKFQELLPKIKKYSDKIFMFLTILLLSSILICQLSLNKDYHKTPFNEPCLPENTNNDNTEQDTVPLLVFAGGGSVRNYLQEVYSLDVRKQLHSINIAIASGSAWRVLSEEYHLDNDKKDNDSVNKFITICLSAGEMSKEFYDEYMSNIDNTIIVAVKLGTDNLVAYFSKGLASKWELNDGTISSKELAQRIQEIIALNQEIVINDELKKVRIFTTNKTSGTLELYKKSLQKYIKLEELMDSNYLSIYYDNMDPNKVNISTSNDDKSYNREFIILGSQYYRVNDLSEKLYSKLNLLNNDKKIQKPMYIYFLAKKVNSNQFKINESVLEFLRKLGNHKEFPKGDSLRWNRIMESGIVFYDMSNSPYIKMEQIN